MGKRNHRADKGLATNIECETLKEPAVEFDFVDLQFAEESLRRMADAEIVNRHTNAKPADFSQRGRCGEVGQNGVADFQRKTFWGEGFSLQRPGEASAEARLLNLQRRDVDCHSHLRVRPDLLENPPLAQCPCQHPFAEWKDQPGFLCLRDKLISGHTAVARVLPPQSKRLKTHLSIVSRVPAVTRNSG